MVNLSYFINMCNGILYSSLFVCKYLCPALFVLLVLGPVSVGGLFKKLASPLWTHIHWYEMKTQSPQFLKTFFSKLTSCMLVQEQPSKHKYGNNFGKKIKILIMPEKACKGRKYSVIIYQTVHNYIAYLYEYEKNASWLNCSNEITLKVKHEAKKSI